MPSMEHPPEAEPMGIEECVQEGDAPGGIDIHSLVCLVSCVSLSMFQSHDCMYSGEHVQTILLNIFFFHS